MKDPSQPDILAALTVTFKQLKSGKVKCNQTKVIMKSRKAQTYRRSLIHQKIRSVGLVAEKPSVSQKVPMKRTESLSHYGAHCPKCSYFCHSNSGAIKCSWCGTNFVGLKIKNVAQICSYALGGIYAYCPFCDWKVRNPRPNANNVCGICRKSFYAE